MSRRANLMLALAAALLAAFAFGVAHLFQLRFDAGDIYPPYSSLRADPLGTRALLESLGAVPGVTATALFDPLPKAGGGRDATLLVLGTPHRAVEEMSRQDVRDLEQFMREGGRVVFAFYPFGIESRYRQLEAERDQRKKAEPGKKRPADKNSPNAKPEKQEPAKKPKARRGGKDDDRIPESLRPVKLHEQWAVSFATRDLATDGTGVAQPVTAERVSRPDGLPAKLAWHTALHFTNLDARWRTNYVRVEQAPSREREVGGPWRTNYSRVELPVVIERDFGRGSLVFCADSYPFSNEALRKDRQTALLAWLLGANRRVVFDETHLGVENQPGVATLARRYRLHGLFGGLFVLALLFVWKNGTSLVPPHDEDGIEIGGHVAGKDSASGFVNLLRRSIPAPVLLSACFAEWRKSHSHWKSHLGPKSQRMEAVVQAQEALPPRERRPADAYLELSRILNERK
ncbi:MAG: DUF4350 domain-containing protein [Limisphaerales bacterium]